jgi:hypothetical protein
MPLPALRTKLESTLNEEDKWPRSEDVKGVTMQLISIQAIYLLNITEFATGTLNATSTDPLTLDEIFYIGRTAYDSNLFYEASLWFRGLADCVKTGMTGEAVTLRKTLRNLAAAYLRVCSNVHMRLVKGRLLPYCLSYLWGQPLL